MSKKIVGVLAVTAVVAAVAWGMKKLYDEVYGYDFQEYSFDDEKEKTPVYVKTQAKTQPQTQEEFKVQDQPQEKVTAQPKTHP